MTDTVSNLMEASLLGVFNERDAQRRARAIETLICGLIRDIVSPCTTGPLAPTYPTSGLYGGPPSSAISNRNPPRKTETYTSDQQRGAVFEAHRGARRLGSGCSCWRWAPSRAAKTRTPVTTP
jgi:hypothetical protein